MLTNSKHRKSIETETQKCFFLHFFSIYVTGFMLFMHLFICGGAMFSYLEGWGFQDSIYFSWITLTTIGLGDFAPGDFYFDELKSFNPLFCLFFFQ